MSVNDNHNDGLERDPRLARLYEAASGEEPPAALDAAILAAARREVSARPQVVGGGGQTSIPPVRAKRNWYVPVSIAAVMVLSVSLVMTLHQEKGDELSQPPAATSQLPKAPAPAAAPAAEPPAASSEKPDAKLRNDAPAKPKVAEEKRVDADRVAKATPTPEAYGELAKKQRTEKLEAAADSAAAIASAARKDQPVGGAAREQGPASETAAAPQARREMQAGTLDRPYGPAAGVRGAEPAPGATFGGLASGTRRPDPFPAASEREAPVTSPAPAQASRDAVDGRQRSEADRNVTRGAMQDAPAAAAPAPPAKVAAAPRRAAPAEDVLAQSAPSIAEGRAAATPPPPPPAKPAPAPVAKPALRLMEKRALLWRGLEDQPSEKWLERLAEFKRDGRQADADELLAEFRRRFPDHPASAR